MDLRLAAVLGAKTASSSSLCFPVCVLVPSLSWQIILSRRELVNCRNGSKPAPFPLLSFSLQVALFRNGKILRSLAAVQVRKGIFCDAILYYK
jgi:hypothetical protein